MSGASPIASKHGPTDPGRWNWLKTALATAGMIMGGVVASFSDIRSQIADQAAALSRVKVDQARDREKLIRIEDKLDQLVQALERKP